MKASLISKLALAAAATVITLTPAMAGRDDRGHDNHIERKYEHRGQHYNKKPYWKRGYVAKKRWWGPRYSWNNYRHHHRHWR